MYLFFCFVASIGYCFARPEIGADGFVVTVKCDQGYALTARQGGMPAHFLTSGEFSTPASCSELTKGSGPESCITRSRSVLSQKSLEHPHTVFDCTDGRTENRRISRYLQGFQITMVDIAGPFMLNYTCCGNEKTGRKEEDCSEIRLDSKIKSGKAEDINIKVKGKFIQTVQYTEDPEDKSWHTTARLCSDKAQPGTKTQPAKIEQLARKLCMKKKPCSICLVSCDELYFTP